MWSKRLELQEIGEKTESHLKCWILLDETQVKRLRVEESQKQTRLVRRDQKLTPFLSGSFINFCLFLWGSRLNKSSVHVYKSKLLSSSSSIFVVFGVIIELNCWISKHTKSYNFCSSTHLIQNALERFILITQSPEPPLKLQKGLRPPLCFKISIWFTCRVNSNQTDHQLRDWSGDKYLFKVADKIHFLHISDLCFVKLEHPGQEGRVHDKFIALKQKHLSLLAPFVSARVCRAELRLGSLQWNLWRKD